MEADLVSRLVAAAIAGDEISWDERRKRGALPAIVLTLIAPGRSYTHEGADPLQDPRIQADIYAASPAEADRCRDAVIATLEPAATVGATRFGNAFLNGSLSMPAETLDGGDHLFRRMLDFSIFHQPAT